MAHLKYPIVGDPLYGGRYRFPPNCAEELAGALETFKRQALHASELKLYILQPSWSAGGKPDCLMTSRAC